MKPAEFSPNVIRCNEWFGRLQKQIDTLWVAEKLNYCDKMLASNHDREAVNRVLVHNAEENGVDNIVVHVEEYMAIADDYVFDWYC